MHFNSGANEFPVRDTSLTPLYFEVIEALNKVNEITELKWYQSLENLKSALEDSSEKRVSVNSLSNHFKIYKASSISKSKRDKKFKLNTKVKTNKKKQHWKCGI